MAQVFFLSGLTKLRDWNITLALFQDEYHVPLLPPAVAAVAGTAGELVLPVLLALGLAGRFAAAGLSVVNVVAVLSLAEIAPAALQQHVFWGSLLVGLLLWGPGRWSLDRFVLAWQARRAAQRWLHSRGLKPSTRRHVPHTAELRRRSLIIAGAAVALPSLSRAQSRRLVARRRRRPWPDGVFQRLGRQRAHQRLPALDGG